MADFFSERASRNLINIFFAYVTCATLVAGWYVSHHLRNWVTSDWLINYEGGFVRRGLPGQAAYIIGKALHVSPATIVAVFYISLLVWFLFSAFRLASRSSLNIWVLALLLSPATFSMQLLNPQAGFHKEILFLASLAAFLVWSQGHAHSSTATIVLLSVFALVAILSHESILFYLPYFFAAFLLSGHTFSTGVRQLALPAVIAVLTAYICSRHLGSEEIASHICGSLGYSFPSTHPNEVCNGGAILYLTRSSSFARLENFALIRQNHYWKLRTLPIPVLFALIPAVGESFVLAHTNRSRAVRVIWGGAAVSFLGTMVLFIYAFDWGRWIYIHIAGIALLLLFSDGRQPMDDSAFAKRIPSVALPQKVAAAMLLFIYATVWSLPNDVKATALFGYAGRAYTAGHVLSMRRSLQEAQ